MFVSAELGRIGNVVNLGSDVGYSNSASGKAIAVVHQGNCNYSFELLEDQHVRINNPDVVFLESNIKLREKSWPYLDQKSISAGYYWSFRKDDSLGLKWFGLMCDDIGSFDFQESSEKALGEISPELKDIKQINGSKCPGVLRGKKWVPNKHIGLQGDYVFSEIVGINWSGFIVGFKGKSEFKKNMIRIRFA